jgi:probable addiction module antidote protein
MTKLSSLKKFDPAEVLNTPEAIAAYIEEAIEIGDPAFIVDALGVVARSKGMSAVARSTGLGRESLYKALRKDGHPEFSTVLRVFDAVGLRLSVEPRASKPAPKAKRKAKATA